jgi:predicted nucleic acid-binding Zn ribbon protein
MVATKNPPPWDAAGAVLVTLVPQLTSPQRWNEYRVWDVWEEAVGEALARKACPTKIQNGTLFVMVSNSILIQELQFAKATMRDRLNQKLEAPVVRDIRFVIGRVNERILRQSIPALRPMPVYTELTVPQLSRPDLEAAFAKLIDARRRRLLKKGEPRGGIPAGEPGKTV